MSDAALLEEIRERRTAASAVWDPIIAEAKKDRQCVAGDVWDAIDPDGKKQRKGAKRPFLALDELGQYINQTVNDVRANPRGLRFAPTGNGANDKGAEFYENHAREIEYRSKASVADSMAFEGAVTSSIGWLRITTKREHVRTFNQDIWIDPVANPDQVLPDPNIVWPDARDMKYLFYIEPWSIPEVERKFGKDIKGISAEWRTDASQWLRREQNKIDLAEYWKLEPYARKLVAFRMPGVATPTIALVDELPDKKLPEGVENVREEDVEDTRVKAWLTNGIHLLQEIKWVGKYIPFVSCFGKIIYVEGERRILSMTRLARDPFMLYCYYRTTEAELAAMAPKFPYFAYEGQLSADELTNLQKSLHEPVAVIRVKPTVEGAPPNQVLAFPARQPYEPPFVGIEAAAESARRAIQAAMGISPLPTEAQRHSQKSGVALRQIESSGQRGSFHFVDHYELMIERRGVIIEDLIDKTIDTARDVPVRNPDDSAAIQRVNDPAAKDPLYTKGDYRVTISTGPATDSQRQMADTFVDSMVSNLQTIAQIASPQKAAELLAKSVKLKQLGPIGDEIVKLLEPPKPMGADGKPLPPEVMQLQQENQQLKGLLQQAAMEKQAKVVEIREQGQVKYSIAKLQEEGDSQRTRENNETKLAVAELGAKVERMALFMEESQLVGARTHEVLEAIKDRLHELNMASVAHQQALEQGAAAHGQALEQADRGVAGQLAVQAAAPQPEAGAEAGA